MLSLSFLYTRAWIITRIAWLLRWILFKRWSKVLLVLCQVDWRLFYAYDLARMFSGFLVFLIAESSSACMTMRPSLLIAGVTLLMCSSLNNSCIYVLFPQVSCCSFILLSKMESIVFWFHYLPVTAFFCRYCSLPSLIAFNTLAFFIVSVFVLL